MPKKRIGNIIMKEYLACLAGSKTFSYEIILSRSELFRNELDADRWMDVLSNCIGWENWRLLRRRKDTIILMISSISDWLMVEIAIGNCLVKDSNGIVKTARYKIFQPPRKKHISYADRQFKASYAMLEITEVKEHSVSELYVQNFSQSKLNDMIRAFLDEIVEGDYEFNPVEIKELNTAIDFPCEGIVWEVRTKYTDIGIYPDSYAVAYGIYTLRLNKGKDRQLRVFF